MHTPICNQICKRAFGARASWLLSTANKNIYYLGNTIPDKQDNTNFSTPKLFYQFLSRK